MFPPSLQFFLPGIKQVWDFSSVRIYNKSGLALGHMIDNGYIWNAETGEGYFLTACIYVNANKCLNDDVSIRHLVLLIWE